MRIVGIDTATRIGSVGLVEDGRVVLEDSCEATRGHGQTLAPLLERQLARAGWSADGLDAVAVSIGPGSFTGLRVGLGFAKGLAFATAVPLVPVPTLDALAAVADADPREVVCPLLDARRDDVYAGFYLASAERRPEALSEALLLRVGALLDRVGGYLSNLGQTPGSGAAGDRPSAGFKGRCRFLGDGVLRHGDLITKTLGERAIVLPFTHYHPAGGMVALIGARRLAAGRIAAPGPLEPDYLRPSYAEARAGKAGNGPGEGGGDAR